jgi:hypothetical protein
MQGIVPFRIDAIDIKILCQHLLYPTNVVRTKGADDSGLELSKSCITHKN